MTADIDSGELWTEAAGQGTPVVLLHGFSFDASSWDDQFDALAARHRVIRYDLRGFGRSRLPTAPYSHVDDLFMLLDRRVDGPAHLIGLSLGANVALSAALVAPQRVRSLVLASSGLPGHVWQDERPPDAALRHAAAQGVEATRDFWLQHPLFASTAARPAVQQRLAAMVRRYSGWHWQPDAPPMQPLPAHADRLADVTTPTLVLGGAEDVPGYRDIAARLQAGIAGAQRCTFANAGHVLNMEVPGPFNAAVLDFLATVDAALET